MGAAAGRLILDRKRGVVDMAKIVDLGFEIVRRGSA